MVEKAVRVLQGGSVLAQFGPMRLVVSAFVGRIAQPEMALKAGRVSFGYLERVARQRGFLGQGFRETVHQVQDPLALRMIESVIAVGDEDLTPMAAVAGTIADAVADHLFERGMTKVVVDNGGDIAVRLGGQEAVTVGVIRALAMEPAAPTVAPTATPRPPPTQSAATVCPGGRGQREVG
jgi:hypothetical protein